MTSESELQQSNPLEASEAREQRIRERAYFMWEADGRPNGRDEEYWERARELEAIAESPGAGQIPVDTGVRAEEAAIQENLGEFPDRFSDQGERQQTPLVNRGRARR